MGMSLIFFPLPRLTHNSESPSDAKKCIARMTTSLSTVWTRQSGGPAVLHQKNEAISWYLPQCGYMAEDKTHHVVC